MKAYTVIFLLWLLLFAGCAMPARSRAVEQLRPVETMGCDTDRQFETVSASSGGEAPMAAAARGGSIPQAMENLRRWSDAQELFFAHVRYVVAGEAFARAGLGELLDYFARSTQTSLEIPLVVVRGGTARELVTAPAGPAGKLPCCWPPCRGTRSRPARPAASPSGRSPGGLAAAARRCAARWKPGAEERICPDRTARRYCAQDMPC